MIKNIQLKIILIFSIIGIILIGGIAILFIYNLETIDINSILPQTEQQEII